MRTPFNAAALTAAAFCVWAAPAHATDNIWLPYASGTTDPIAAVDYVGPGDIWHAAGLTIFHNGSPQATLPNLAGTITDLRFNPSGTVALATSTGTSATTKLWRYTGTTWNAVATNTYAGPCDGGHVTSLGQPSGALRHISWADDSTAFVVGDDPGMVLKGNASFTEVDKKADGTCFIPFETEDQVFTDIDAADASKAITINANFGHRIRTTGAFAAGNTLLANSSTCQDAVSNIVFDPGNSLRTWTAGDCEGGFALEFSSNDGVDYTPVPINDPGGRIIAGLTDLDVSADGSAIAVGRNGDIVVAPSPARAYFQPYGTAAATYTAVSKLDATHAVIGAFNGSMLISAQANAAPDPPPTGTAGGTTPPGSGSTPAGGTPAGSTGGGTTSGGTGRVPVGTRNPTPSRTVGVAVGGVGNVGSITLGGPRTCVPVGKTFTATLSFKRKTKKQGRKAVKVFKVFFFVDGKKVKTDKRPLFKQKLSVKSYKPGSKHTLKARAFLKVGKGKKSPSKSISTSFQVCSS